MGNHVIESWSVTQSVVSLSSGEAEYYGLLKAFSNAMGIRSVASDLGIDLKIRVCTESFAAEGIASRTGLGKVRHVEVAQLWVQEKVRNGEVVIEKVDGKHNLSDCLTKHVGREDNEWQMCQTHQYVLSGRHAMCPETV